MPDFTNTTGWSVQQLTSNLEEGGSSLNVLAPNNAALNGFYAQSVDPTQSTLVATIALGSDTLYVTKLAVLDLIESTALYGYGLATTVNGGLIDPATGDVLAAAAFAQVGSTGAWVASWANKTAVRPGPVYAALWASAATTATLGVSMSAGQADAANLYGIGGSSTSILATTTTWRCASVAEASNPLTTGNVVTLTSLAAATALPWLGLL